MKIENNKKIYINGNAVTGRFKFTFSQVKDEKGSLFVFAAAGVCFCVWAQEVVLFLSTLSQSASAMRPRKQFCRERRTHLFIYHDGTESGLPLCKGIAKEVKRGSQAMTLILHPVAQAHG